MFKKMFCAFMFVVMICSMPLGVFAQSNEQVPLEVIDRYVIDDEDDDVVFHEIVVMSDGSSYANVVKLISETISKDNNSMLRDPGGSGTASKVYRHSVYGFSASGVQAISEFDFEIKYNYNTAYPGYSANAMTYAYCSSVKYGFTSIKDVGRSENTAWVEYIDQSGHAREKYTYTVSYGVVNVSRS